jgi:TolB-like protein
MTEPMDGPDERLESWKKIAAYLRRDVRTVQRWEQTHGLPVHRLSRAQRPIPYAYKKELDDWWKRQSQSALPAEPARPRRRFAFAAVIAAVVLAAGVALFAWWRHLAPPSRSVAVLPFVDLTEGMPNEEFADGITEEIIDRLNRKPGVRAPAPTSTFFYKNKQVPVAEIARALNVAYVLDGSVRTATDRVRVAARLIRAADNAVVWSASYEEPAGGILRMQDDISAFAIGGIDRAFLRGGD